MSLIGMEPADLVIAADGEVDVYFVEGQSRLRLRSGRHIYEIAITPGQLCRTVGRANRAIRRWAGDKPLGIVALRKRKKQR